MANPARRWLDQAVESRLRWLVDRLDKLAAVQNRQRDRIAQQAERLRKQGERLERQHERVRAVEETYHDTSVAYETLRLQMAALETRMQQLVDRLEPAPDSSEPERAEARSLLDQVREEHSRIRTRFGVVTRYEERIRRLERALEPTPDP